MLHLVCVNQTSDDPRLASWGRFTRYLEIGDDRYAKRHVDSYVNGNFLSYDRSHWADDYGMLADMRYDKKKWTRWWGPQSEISAEDFELVWQDAMSSPVRVMQSSTAKMLAWGVESIWITRLKDKRFEK
jgi:hypothetical protein